MSAFRVELAKTARATCKGPGCGNPKIEANSLRVGREQSNSFFGSDSTSLKWYHPECFAELNSRARKHKVTDAAAEIAGFDDLSEDDQRLLKMLVHESLQHKEKKKKPKVGEKRKTRDDDGVDDFDGDDQGDDDRGWTKNKDKVKESKKDKTPAPKDKDGGPNRQFSPSSKPDCWYGEKCYRRNPEHLAQYRHPNREIARASSSSGSAVSMAGSDDEDSNAGEESDFVPSDSEVEDGGVPTDSVVQEDRDEDDAEEQEEEEDVKQPAPKKRKQAPKTPQPEPQEQQQRSSPLAQFAPPPLPVAQKTQPPSQQRPPHLSSPAPARSNDLFRNVGTPGDGHSCAVAAFAVAMPGRPFVPDLPVEVTGGPLAERPPALFVPMERRRNRFVLPPLSEM